MKKITTLALVAVLLLATICVSAVGIACPECHEGEITSSITDKFPQSFFFRGTHHDCDNIDVHWHGHTVVVKTVICSNCSFSSTWTSFIDEF